MISVGRGEKPKNNDLDKQETQFHKLGAMRQAVGARLASAARSSLQLRANLIRVRHDTRRQRRQLAKRKTFKQDRKNEKKNLFSNLIKHGTGTLTIVLLLQRAFHQPMRVKLEAGGLALLIRSLRNGATEEQRKKRKEERQRKKRENKSIAIAFKCVYVTSDFKNNNSSLAVN
jgi:hypothetical protein